MATLHRHGTRYWDGAVPAPTALTFPVGNIGTRQAHKQINKLISERGEPLEGNAVSYWDSEELGLHGSTLDGWLAPTASLRR